MPCLLGLAAINYACLFYRPLLLAMALANLGFLLACVVAWVLHREPRQPARLRQ